MKIVFAPDRSRGSRIRDVSRENRMRSRGGQRRGTEKRRSSQHQTSPSAAEDRPRRKKPRRVAVGS